MLPEEQIQQIEAWLDGTLPSGELTAFEARLQNEPDFAEEVQLHRSMRQAAREKDIGVFRQTVDDLLNKIDNSEKNRPRAKLVSMARYFWATAAVLLLALAAVWFFRTPEPNMADLYAAAFEPPAQFRYVGMPKDAVRDTSVRNVLPDWAKLNESWSVNKSDDALQRALEIARTDTSLTRSQSAYYAAGVIALSQQKAEEALAYLDKAGTVKPYSEDILWYKTLAQVQISQKDTANETQAIKALENIINSPQPENRLRLAKKMLKSLQKR